MEPTQRYAVLDTETTGFSADSDRVIQIAVIHLDPAFRVEGAWSSLINPQRRWITGFHVHRLSSGKLSRHPTFADVAADLERVLASRTIVGHNVAYDLRMINGELGRLGRHQLDPPAIDTWRLAKELLPGLPNRKLGTVAANLRIPLTRAHDATADAYATAEVFMRLMRRRDPLAGVPVSQWADEVQQHWTTAA